MFYEMEDCAVILFKGGVYTQAPLFRHDNHVFAKVGSGFIRLCSANTTSTKALVFRLALADGWELQPGPLGHLRITKQP